MKRLPQFDVFEAGSLGGPAFGDYLETIGARDHRVAKDAAERLYAGIARVVVLPAGRRDSTHSAPAPVTRSDFRPRGAHPRSTPHRTRR